MHKYRFIYQIRVVYYVYVILYEYFEDDNIDIFKDVYLLYVYSVII